MWILLFTGLAVTGAPACSVPVFRYALERWEPDVYPVVIFHKGPPDEQTQKLIQTIEAASRDEKVPANVVLQTADTDGEMEPALREVWQRQSAKSLPWMVVRSPHIGSKLPDVWAGTPTMDIVHSLLDSPGRQKIVKRILGGETAVWLILESGHPEKDNAAVKLIEQQLAQMEKTLQLPEVAGEDQSLLSEDGPELKIKFSTVRVSRSDAQEAMTLRLLLGTEADLPTLDEPMIFPVFGQGRAYFALVGDGIDVENIGEIGTFLTGQCSCEVKRQNPGTDLLFTANWRDLGRKLVREETPSTFTVTGSSASVSPRAESPLWRSLLAVGGVMFVVVGGSLLLMARSSGNKS